METSDARTRGQRLLGDVREGMVVHAVDGQTLGTVRRVFLGSPADTGPATPSDVSIRHHTFLDDLAEAIAPDELPEEMRERLRLSGFIRIDMAGMLRSDRYALPEQIAAVHGQEITLSVSRDELLAA